jgi:hypothetical protein
VFGRRKREEAAAAEAAQEAERRALLARLAERPEHVCPFLGLESERTGYVDGVSDEHRCFAFGDPAPISAEQQTRVCQERGYGNCPRYLRGVLVIPTEELEALRRPRAPIEEPPPLPPAMEGRRRRRAPLAILLVLLVALVGGVGGALAIFGDDLFGVGSSSPTPTVASTPSPAPETPEPTEPAETPTPGAGTPTPEPTPEPGDVFVFYEVSVGPEAFRLFLLDADGQVQGTRTTAFRDFSFALTEPLQGTDGVYWVTLDGGLEGWAYRHPDSGDFRIRAVFRDAQGERRSSYLATEELTVFPEATPAP